MEIEDSQRIPLHKKIEAATRMALRARNQETVTAISQDLQISRNHLYLLEARYQEDPMMGERERAGRPKKVNDYFERRVLREIRNDPFQSFKQIANNVNHGMEEEKQIAPTTVRDVAHRAGFKAYRPLAKPLLTDVQMGQRLDFAKNLEERTMNFWRHVIFMDETFVRLHPKDSRERVWRQEGERMEPQHLVPSIKYGGGGVMFWGCVTWAGVGPLVYIDERLDGDLYGQILWDNIPQVKDMLGIRAAYIVEDGARIHNIPEVLEIKELLDLRDLELPPYSPDLNVIESAWNILKMRIARRGPGTLEELVTVAQEEWDQITLEEIRNLFTSIPFRLSDVVDRHGGHTKY